MPIYVTPLTDSAHTIYALRIPEMEKEGRMATVNVYVPDDMKERLDALGDVNLSALARRCWDEAIAIHDLPEGTFHIDAEDNEGLPVQLRFEGSLIALSHYDGRALYLTAADQFVWIEDDGRFSTGPREEIDLDEALQNFFGRDEEALATACGALGVRRVIEL
jgi:hypothetical protein